MTFKGLQNIQKLWPSPGSDREQRSKNRVTYISISFFSFLFFHLELQKVKTRLQDLLQDFSSGSLSLKIRSTSANARRQYYTLMKYIHWSVCILNPPALYCVGMPWAAKTALDSSGQAVVSGTRTLAVDSLGPVAYRRGVSGNWACTSASLRYSHWDLETLYCFSSCSWALLPVFA